MTEDQRNGSLLCLHQCRSRGRRRPWAETWHFKIVFVSCKTRSRRQSSSKTAEAWDRVHLAQCKTVMLASGGYYTKRCKGFYATWSFPDIPPSSSQQLGSVLPIIMFNDQQWASPLCICQTPFSTHSVHCTPHPQLHYVQKKKHVSFGLLNLLPDHFVRCLLGMKRYSSH